MGQLSSNSHTNPHYWMPKQLIITCITTLEKVLIIFGYTLLHSANIMKSARADRMDARVLSVPDGYSRCRAELVTSPKDPYRHRKQKQGRVLGGQKEGGGAAHYTLYFEAVPLTTVNLVVIMVLKSVRRHIK